MNPIYQWIFKDNSEFSFDKFEMSDDFWESEDEIYSNFPFFKESRSIIGKYLPSEIKDDRSIQIIKKHRNKKYDENTIKG